MKGEVHDPRLVEPVYMWDAFHMLSRCLRGDLKMFYVGFSGCVRELFKDTHTPEDWEQSTVFILKIR